MTREPDQPRLPWSGHDINSLQVGDLPRLLRAATDEYERGCEAAAPARLRGHGFDLDYLTRVTEEMLVLRKLVKHIVHKRSLN
jgi:hypothetical protein